MRWTKGHDGVSIIAQKQKVKAKRRKGRKVVDINDVDVREALG